MGFPWIENAQGLDDGAGLHSGGRASLHHHFRGLGNLRHEPFGPGEYGGEGKAGGAGVSEKTEHRRFQDGMGPTENDEIPAPPQAKAHAGIPLALGGGCPSIRHSRP